MRVLITGGAGFIGSTLADRLLARGDEVLIIDDFATGRRDSVPLGATLVEGHIAEPGLVDGVAGRFRPEVIVHAAATYKDPTDWLGDAQSNVVGSVRVAQAARAHRVRRIIYFQTSLCYGPRPRETPITLTHPMDPHGSYAVSKTAGEQVLLQSGLDVVSFRLANMFGPRNLSGPVPTFYKRLTAGQPCTVVDSRRDFVLVDDLIDVVVPAIDGRGERGAYHVASGRDFAIKDLYDAVQAALGLSRPVEVKPRGQDDVFTLLLDPSKTERDFGGWRVKTPLAEGVARVVAWYREHPVTETYTHLKEKG
jgi:UDP-glucose 4-epimerase